MRGVVSALHDLPVGAVWPRDRLAELAERIDAADLSLAVIESIPVHEDIKLGRPTRDKLIDAYCASVRHMGEIGVPVLCYNFMPIFDWTRTDLARALPDGSTSLAYDDDALAAIDLSRGTGNLPGWGAAYDATKLGALLEAYREIDEERLWENLAHFLERVVPVAESSGVRMAIHPDDPPWSIFGLPRIVTNAPALERLVRLVDRPANGVTFCTGCSAPMRGMIFRRWHDVSVSSVVCTSLTAETSSEPVGADFTRRRIRQRSATSTCWPCCGCSPTRASVVRCDPIMGG